MKRPTSVVDYIDAAELWREELVSLREILLTTGLEETVKWGAPCYAYGSKSI